MVVPLVALKHCLYTVCVMDVIFTALGGLLLAFLVLYFLLACWSCIVMTWLRCLDPGRRYRLRVARYPDTVVPHDEIPIAKTLSYAPLGGPVGVPILAVSFSFWSLHLPTFIISQEQLAAGIVVLAIITELAWFTLFTLARVLAYRDGRGMGADRATRQGGPLGLFMRRLQATNPFTIGVPQRVSGVYILHWEIGRLDLLVPYSLGGMRVIRTQAQGAPGVPSGPLELLGMDLPDDWRHSGGLAFDVVLDVTPLEKGHFGHKGMCSWRVQIDQWIEVSQRDSKKYHGL